PKTLETLGNNAFQSCDKLWNVEFSYYDKIYYLSIGNYAFADCTNLTNISFSENVTSIGNYAFSGCSSLRELVLPESISDLSIGYYMISGTLITSITVPKMVTSCNKYYVNSTSDNYGPFAGADYLTSVTFESGMVTIPSLVCAGCSYLTDIVIPEGVKGIASCAFLNCTKLTGVILPDSMVSIGSYAFRNCDSISSITTSESTTEICSYAFYDCDGLSELILLEGLTTIDEYAFYGCDSLLAVSFPMTLGTMGNNAFQNCNNLKSIEFTYYDKFYFLVIGNYAFADCTSLTDITLSENVTNIGNYAFSGCSALKTLTLPESIYELYLGYYIIEGTMITNIVIPKAVKDCGKYYVNSTTNNYGPFAGAEMLTTVTFESGVSSIPAYICAGCTYLTSVKILTSACSIETCAFLNCTQLESIYFEGTVYSPYESVNAFYGVTATAYYNSSKDLDAEDMSGYGGSITWVNLTEETEESTEELTEESTEESYSLDAALSLVEDESEIEAETANASAETEAGDGTESDRILIVESETDGTNESATGSGTESVTDTETGSDIETGSNSISESSQETEMTDSAEASTESNDGSNVAASAETEMVANTEISVEQENTNDTETDTPSESAVEDNSGSAEEEASLTTWFSSWAQLGAVSGSTSGEDLEMMSVFTDLVPGAEYVLLVVKDEAAASLLDADNLLYIAQGTASSSGTLTFSYMLREAADSFAASVYGEVDPTINISNCTVKLSYYSVNYSGSAKKPAVTVTYDSVKLTQGTDYTVTYADNKNAGTASVTVTGIGDYSGSTVVNFTIKKLTPEVTAEISSSELAAKETAQITATSTGGTEFSYESSDTSVAKVSDSGLVTGVSEGTAVITVTALETTNYSSGSTTLTVTVTGGSAEAVMIVSQPEDYTGEVGTTASFTIEATGEGISYQWQYSDDGGTTWKDSTAASAATATYSLTMTAARNGRLVRCIVTDESGNYVVSDTAEMILVTASVSLVITSQPEDYTGTAGTTASFTIGVEGEDVSYLWQYSDDNGATWYYSTASSAATATYTMTIIAAYDGRQVRCIVIDANENSLTSNVATLTVEAEVAGPTITAQPEDYIGDAGDSVTFTIQAEGTGLSYKWQYSDDGETWKTGASTIASYTTTLTAARSGRMVRCIVTDADGNSVTSETAVMTVAGGPVITVQPESYTGKAGDSVTFTILAEGTDLTYEWQYSSDGGETWKTGSSTTVSYTTTLTAARSGRMVRCIVTDADGNSTTSKTATMT
ncbi:MAG: leucine-rich repeat protein, partial [Clostridiales bacterium]|nr:leucine-rich repeat protein [Clostridiales bacterium]